MVGGVQREMGWWAIAAYVMYTDGELSHGKPGSAKGSGLTASWSKSQRSLSCGDARCELTLQLTNTKETIESETP